MTFANAKQNTITLQSALFRFVAQRRELIEFSPHHFAGLRALEIVT